jgi:dihydroorotase
VAKQNNNALTRNSHYLEPLHMKHPNTRIRIDNATWVNTQGQDHQGALFIEGDRIVAIDQEPAGFEADDTLSATGLRALPGMIDCFAYLPDTNSANISIHSETAAAAAAGFSTLICSPEMNPVLDSNAHIMRLTEAAQTAGHIEVKALGAMTQALNGQQLSNMHALHQGGCVALSQGFAPFANLLVMRRAFEYAATFDFLFVSLPWLDDLAADGCAHEGGLCSQMGLNGIAETVETIAIAQQLLMAEATGLRIHFTGISCQRSLSLIAEARDRGVSVTADTSIAHLLFNEQCIEGFNSCFHVRPPLRSATDQAALIEAVKAGWLMISSHHKAVEYADKATPFAASKPGISLYDGFPAALVTLHEKGLSWAQIQTALALLPAQRFGLKHHHIDVGQRADLCLIDPKAEWRLNESTSCSVGHNQPWWRQKLKGRNRLTLNAGRLVYTCFD